MARFVQLVRQHWGKILAVGTPTVILLAWLISQSGGIGKAVEYYSNYQSKSDLSFKPEDYGVLVCFFDGEDEYKEFVSKDYFNLLSARFREL